MDQSTGNVVSDHPTESDNNEQPSSSQLSPRPIQVTSMLKKTSPLKRVNPIIKKYDCQRQAKNGKSSKNKVQGKEMEEALATLNPTHVQDFAAGLDSLDAALRRAEKNMNKVQGSNQQVEQSLELNADELGYGEEDGVSSVNSGPNQPPSGGGVRSSLIRNRNRVLKKRNQLKKDLDHALPLAVPDHSTILEEKAEEYARAYFEKVRERFETKDPPIFQEFLDMFMEVSSTISVTDFYHRLMKLFEGHPDLCEEFMGFLQPQEALQCGKFMEHLAFVEMLSFHRKLELHFAKQPQHYKKILSTISRFAEAPELSSESVRSAILPLLRGNTFLIDSFLALLPSEKPPESKMTDFDLVTCKDMDSEDIDEKEPFERVDIPPENDDLYGNENCQCCCHMNTSDDAYTNRSKHCIPCGIKFIAGKVFVQTNQGLRPVKVGFAGERNSVKRLNANHPKLSRSKLRRGQGNTPQLSLKTEDCKQGDTDDEATFTNKVKSPRNRPKIIKPSREKPPSARTLILCRGGTCVRKSAMGKLSPMPVVNDQEALPAPSPSEEKPSVMDFSMISNVIQIDQDEDDQEAPPEVKFEATQKLGIAEDDSKETNSENEVVLSDQTIGNPSRQNVSAEESDPKYSEEESKIKTEDRKGVDNVENQGEEETGDKYRNCDATSRALNIKQAEDCAGDGDTKANERISAASPDHASGDTNEEATWTKEEDRIILCTFQSERDQGKALLNVCSQIPYRTNDEISSRLQFLVSFIQKLKKDTK